MMKNMCGIPTPKVAEAYELWNSTSMNLVQVARGLRLNYTNLYRAIELAEKRGLHAHEREVS